MCTREIYGWPVMSPFLIKHRGNPYANLGQSVKRIQMNSITTVAADSSLEFYQSETIKLVQWEQ